MKPIPVSRQFLNLLLASVWCAASFSASAAQTVVSAGTVRGVVNGKSPAANRRNEKCGADIRGVRSPLHNFRFHDCRHHSITRLCEVQATDSIIREIAGHVSPKMLAH